MVSLCLWQNSRELGLVSSVPSSNWLQKKCMVGEGGSLGIIHWIKNGKSTGIGVIHWIKNGKSTGGGYADGLIRVMVVCSAFIENF